MSSEDQNCESVCVYCAVYSVYCVLCIVLCTVFGEIGCAVCSSQLAHYVVCSVQHAVCSVYYEVCSLLIKMINKLYVLHLRIYSK